MTEAAAISVALPAVLDLDALDGVRDRLIEVVETGPVVIAGGGVERVATNGLLMLLSAAQTAKQNGYTLEIADASDTMLAAIERLGLAPGFAGLTKG